MYETLQPAYPKGPTNRTDPIVRHESHYEPEQIVTLYNPQARGEDTGTQGKVVDDVAFDGIYYPLIRINNHMLIQSNIVKFVLHNDRFMPYLDLVFRDDQDIIQFSDMPGLNNVITVALLEQDIHAHKPIRMDFYVTSCKVSNNMFYVQAEFKCLPLEQQIFRQDVFHYPDEGCSSQFCELPANDAPTTFEFLHVIAEKCGLGFSATQKCRSIKDDRYRLLKKEKYKDAAQLHTSCGGLDDMSIFDSWIDPWAILTMVNHPWVMSQTVHPNELSSKMTAIVPMTDKDTQSTKKTEDCHRILTNMYGSEAGLNNMMITSIEKLVDLKSGYYKGTDTQYNTIEAAGVGESEGNTLSTQTIREQEYSLSAARNQDKFNFQNQCFAGFEMGIKTPTVAQRHRHDEYWKQQRANMFKVTLQECNFGLERGMLCMIIWYAETTVQKMIIMNNTKKLKGDKGGNDETNKAEAEAKDGIDDQTALVMDPALSGFYYIDGTDWEYDNITSKTIQHLYLIKKGAITQYYN